MRDLFEDVARTELPRGQRRAIRAHWRAGRLGHVFPAGSSAGPQLLVGREEQLARLRALGDELLWGRSAGGGRIIGVALHGPRGTGKTVLLSSFRRALTAARGGGATAVDLSGESVPSDPRELAELISSEAPTGGARWEGNIEASGAMAGLANVKAGISRKPGGAASPMGVARALAALSDAAGGKPVLVTMDEAHAAPPEALGVLLNAAQVLSGKEIPVAVALAGTPDLVDALDNAKATWFMDRASQERLVPVGNLSAADCMATVAAPLAALELKFDQAALDAAAEWCRGSPYFSQLLGLVALENASDGHVDFAAGGAVESAFRAQAEQRYVRAWRGLETRGMTTCARQLGALWRWNGEAPQRRISRLLVDNAVRSGLRHPMDPERPRPDAAEALSHFQHLGLLWQPSGGVNDDWELGLPSFFDYVEARFRDTRNDDERALLAALDADLRERFCRNRPPPGLPPRLPQPRADMHDNDSLTRPPRAAGRHAVRGGRSAREGAPQPHGAGQGG